MKPSLFALVLLALLTAVPARAQAPPLTLTLDDAVSRALAGSHRLAEAGARHDVAEAVVGQRQAAQQPQVTALAGYTRTNHIDPFGLQTPDGQFRVIYPDVPDNYRTRVDVALPLYTGGRLQAFERAARQESTATSGDVDAVRADVRLETERAFWALVVADESLTLVTESLTRSAAHVGNVRSALQAGLVPPNDLLTAEAQQARQRMQQAQGRSARAVAEADLARLIGVPVGTALAPVRPSAADAGEGDVAALVARAVAQRRDRQAIVDRQSAAATRVEAAAALRRPAVAVAGGVDYANPNPRIFPRQAAWRTSWDASVSVSWALFDGGRARAEGAEAVAAKRVLDARLRELDSVIALEIQQRLSEIDASGVALQAADAELAAATEALRVVNDRYAAGVAISSDVLDAQVLVLQASLDRTQATASRQLAAARLRRAIGQ